MGIYGPWGIGKTTLIQYVCDEIQKVLAENRERKSQNPFFREQANEPLIFEFEPWLFSERRDLIVAFFEALSDEVRTAEQWLNAADLAKKFEQYARLLTPVDSLLNLSGFPGVVSGVFSWFGNLMGHRSSSELLEVKNQIKCELYAERCRMIVIIDDLDRLVPQEIVAILRMVKAVGDFPRTTFVLSCDDKHVKRAVRKVHGEGTENYLEKIVQVAFRVPVPSEGRRKLFMKRCLWGNMHELEEQEYADERFDMYWETGMKALLPDLRAVKRVSNSLSFAWEMVGGEVDPIDLWVVETLRVTRPEFYRYLMSCRELVEDEKSPNLGKEAKEGREARQRKYEKAKEQFSSTGEKLLRVLFPNPHSSDGSLWIRLMRPHNALSQAEYFERYFALEVSSELVKEEEFEALLDKIKVISDSDLASGRNVFVGFARKRPEAADDLERRIITYFRQRKSYEMRDDARFASALLGFCEYLDRMREFEGGVHKSLPSYKLLSKWLGSNISGRGTEEVQPFLDLLSKPFFRKLSAFFTWAQALSALEGVCLRKQVNAARPRITNILEDRFTEALKDDATFLHSHPNAATAFAMIAGTFSEDWAAGLLCEGPPHNLVGARVCLQGFEKGLYIPGRGSTEIEDWPSELSSTTLQWINRKVLSPLTDIEEYLSTRELALKQRIERVLLP